MLSTMLFGLFRPFTPSRVWNQTRVESLSTAAAKSRSRPPARLPESARLKRDSSGRPSARVAKRRGGSASASRTW